jgi:hypothetical protein
MLNNITEKFIKQKKQVDDLKTSVRESSIKYRNAVTSIKAKVNYPSHRKHMTKTLKIDRSKPWRRS